MTEDPNALLSLIADKNLSYKKLVKVVLKLVQVREPPKFWSDIANSDEYTKGHRRIAIFELFQRHVKLGVDLSKLGEILDKPTWLKDRSVEIVTTVYGYVPLKHLSPGTVFRICVFPELKGLEWSVYLRVSGEVSLDDFLKVIHRQDAKEQVKEAKLLELGLTTPDFGEGNWNASGLPGINDQNNL